ncbi:hypothetical protein HDK77DRAFT_27214 [Phyllosticta capitalensis]|uniref:Uncharacterized protein n=1 Tax=Phyllosticta capitalensis TaxID=121624 RepID=A0ABR1Z014_9PEZI
MKSSLLLSPLFALLACAQDGYIGYRLEERGSTDDVLYETANTNTNISATVPPPDVFLNASVSVREIDIEVDNITAKINLDAEVLNLLSLNAGVTASIDRVFLTIQDVRARVMLEARLERIVNMVESILDSIDLNPIIATLGEDLGDLVNHTVGGLTGSSDSSSSSSTSSNNLTARGLESSYNLVHNILYSVNDYSGNKHTNRILAQDGSIVDQSLDNNGNPTGHKVVGNYDRDMHYNGVNLTTTRDGQVVNELEYVYSPFPGLVAISAIFVSESGQVLATQVLSESRAGGTSTVSDDSQDL